MKECVSYVNKHFFLCAIAYVRVLPPLPVVMPPLNRVCLRGDVENILKNWLIDLLVLRRTDTL